MSNQENDAGLSYESIFLARQPIFTPELNIWGYQLQLRHSEQVKAGADVDAEELNSKLIADGFALAQRGINPEHKFMISFPHQSLMDESAYVLPPEYVVISLSSEIRPAKTVVQACVNLKKNKYALALEDYNAWLGYEKFMQIVDYIKVDVLDLPKEELVRIIENLQQFPAMILATGLETREAFEEIKEMGSNLFQGFFFSKPEIIPGKSLSSNQLSKLRLLNILSNNQGYEPDKISEIIESDLALSYRLLRYINSPAVGLPNKIKSIKHAVNLLGFQKIKRWCRVIALADLNTTTQSLELTRFSTQRARFLQLLSAEAGSALDKEGMFLLGLFSLLDSILEQSMQEIIKQLPLEDQIARTLVGEETELTNWLELVRAQEKADWTQVNALIHKLGLTPEITAACYVQAMQWTSELLETG